MIERIIRKIEKEWRHSPFRITKKNPNPTRWGIIGLGYMAEVFSTAIDGNPNGIVAAVASRTLDKAKRFASNHRHCKAYGSYDGMLSDKNLQLDIIYIATPAKCHYEHIKLCLNAGTNVLCEKPITSSYTQFEELVHLAKEKKCFLMEGMWMKCLPTFREAVEWIGNGLIGDVELIRTDFYKRELIDSRYTIFNASEGGGVLRDYGVYAIAFMLHFLGGIPDKIFSASRKSAERIDTDWCITAEKDGVKAIVNISSNFGSISKAAVIGSKGYIEWNAPFNRTNMLCLYDEKGNLREKFKARYKYEGFEYEVDEVQRCIKNSQLTSVLSPLTETGITLKIIDQITC